MKPVISKIVIGATLAIWSVQAHADSFSGKDTLIGFDLSDSAPLVQSYNHAKLIAQTIFKTVRAGKYGDRIRLRSFGSYDASQNPLRIDKVLSRHNRPRIVARNLFHLIRHIPAQVRSGKLKTQSSTHIVAFLNDMAPTMKCTTKQPGSVVLYTDGVESSRRTQINIRTWQITLPPPVKDIYKHCHFHLYGAGQLGDKSDERITESVISAWTSWAKQAGFTKIQIVRVW